MAKRDRFRFEPFLQRRCKGEQRLQYEHGADPECQISVAKMRRKRQRRIELAAAGEPLEDRPNDKSIDGDGELRESILRLHPEKPQRQRQQYGTNKHDTPYAKRIKDRTVVRRPLHHIKLMQFT